MAKPAVIWVHGKDSSPWSTKSTALREVARERGLDMQAPDFQPVMDPDERVHMLVETLRDRPGPLVLVGSSMGGYVATVASRELDVRALFLLNPAFYLSPGYHWIDFPWLATPATIVHGWRDEIVPVENVYRFARIHRCVLHVLDGEHRLHEELDQVCGLFREFLHTLGL